MNKMYKWTKQEQNLVLQVVAAAKERLNMTSWSIINEFVDGQIQGEHMDNGQMFINSALSSVTQEYEKISISWMPALLKDYRELGENELRESIYHELVHGLTHELFTNALDRFSTRDQCLKALERLTQRIAKIVCTQTSTKKRK